MIKLLGVLIGSAIIAYICSFILKLWYSIPVQEERSVPIIITKKLFNK